MKLTTRLILIFLLLSLLPLTVVGVLGYTSARRELVAAAQDRLVSVNALKQQELDRWLEGNLYDLQSLAQRPLLVADTRTLSRSSPASDTFQQAQADLIDVHLRPRQRLDEGIVVLYVLDADTGVVLASLDPALEGRNLSDEDVYFQGREGTYLGPPRLSAVGDSTMLDVSAPITTDDGTVIGVLAGALDPAILNEIMRGRSEVSQTQETYLVNQRGEIVTRLRLDEPDHRHAGLRTEASNQCLDGRSGSGTYRDYRGEEVIGAYRWLPDIQSCLITEVDLHEALAPVNDLRDEAILVMVIAAAVMAVLGVLFARELLVPIRQLVTGTAEIGRGNLGYRIDSQRRDELGRLAVMFNLMAEDLDTGQRALREANETLEQQVKERTAALAGSLEELRQSEERYRALVDNVPVGLYRTALDGRILEANPALVDMLGYPDREALLGINARSLYVEPEHRDKKIEYLKTEDILRNSIYQLRRYDGRVIWVNDTMRAIRDEQGTFLYSEGSLQDITEQRQAANREREQRQFAEALTDIGAALNSTLDLDDVLDQILDAVARVVPHDAAHILLLDEGTATLARSRGRGAEGMQDRKERVAFDIAGTTSFRTILNTRQPLIIADVRQFEEWVQLAGRGWVRAHLGAPITINDEVLGFVTVDSSQPDVYQESHARRMQAFADQAAIALRNARLFEEITEHRDNLAQLVEASTIELRHTKEEIEAILRNNPDPILLLEPDGTIVMSNPAFHRLFGPGSADRPAASLLDIFAEDQQLQLRNTLALVSRERHTARLELIAADADGAPRDFDLALAPIEENGDLLSIVCSLRDITSLRDSERMKDAFMSMAAHELRTPLTSIRGFSEILLNRALEPELQRRYLTFINEQSEHLGGIIDGLLDVARLKAGRGMKLSFQPTDLGQIVRAIVEPIAASSARHTFALSGLDDLPLVVCDGKRMGQVVLNLITNAVKYSPGGGEIAIRGETERDHAVLRVSDEGIGLTADQLGRIFEPFYRVDTSNTAQEGTGLGLAICRMIVEAHGGTIDTDSRFGEGSTFTVRLPLRPC